MKKFFAQFWKKLKADPKTTLAVILGFAAWLIAKFGFEFSADDQTVVIAFSLLILGIFSQDTRELPPTGSNTNDL